MSTLKRGMVILVDFAIGWSCIFSTLTILPLRQAVNTLAARISLEYDVLIGPRVIGQQRWTRMATRNFGLYHNIAAEGILLSSASSG